MSKKTKILSKAEQWAIVNEVRNAQGKVIQEDDKLSRKALIATRIAIKHFVSTYPDRAQYSPKVFVHDDGKISIGDSGSNYQTYDAQGNPGKTVPASFMNASNSSAKLIGKISASAKTVFEQSKLREFGEQQPLTAEPESPVGSGTSGPYRKGDTLTAVRNGLTLVRKGDQVEIVDLRRGRLPGDTADKILVSIKINGKGMNRTDKPFNVSYSEIAKAAGKKLSEAEEAPPAADEEEPPADGEAPPADDGGAPPPAGGDDKQVKAPTEPVTVKFSQTAVRRYNNVPLEGNVATVTKVTKDGIVAADADGTEIMVGFDDITESVKKFFKSNKKHVLLEQVNPSQVQAVIRKHLGPNFKVRVQQGNVFTASSVTFHHGGAGTHGVMSGGASDQAAEADRQLAIKKLPLIIQDIQQFGVVEDSGVEQSEGNPTLTLIVSSK